MRFRILHLSDLHFCLEPKRLNGPTLVKRGLVAAMDTAVAQGRALGVASLFKPSSFSPEPVPGIAEFCFRKEKITDRIVISGDLATTGMGVDINTVAAFVTSPAHRNFQTSNGEMTLSTIEADIDVMPGNHDVFRNDKGTPGSPHFGLAFADFMPNLAGRVAHDLITKEPDKLALVFADFTLKSRFDGQDTLLGVFGQGSVYDDVLNALTIRTRDLRSSEPGVKIIWVVHFAPFNCGYGLELWRYQSLQQAARQMGILAVLCGHTHDRSKTTVGGVQYYCAGSACAMDRENDHWVHEIEIDSGRQWSIRRNNYRFSRSDGQFSLVDTD